MRSLLSYSPHFFFFGALVSGLYGFTGLSATADQAALARTLFYICAVFFVPLFVWRYRSMRRFR